MSPPFGRSGHRKAHSLWSFNQLYHAGGAILLKHLYRLGLSGYDPLTDGRDRRHNKRHLSIRRLSGRSNLGDGLARAVMTLEDHFRRTFAELTDRLRSEISRQTAAVAEELIAAYNKEGAAMTRRDNTHRMADANKAFAHCAW